MATGGSSSVRRSLQLHFDGFELSGLDSCCLSANVTWSDQMVVQRIIHLCNNVEAMAFTLGRLNERASGDEAQAVLLRMKLAALTTELIAADLIERARQRSVLTPGTPFC